MRHEFTSEVRFVDPHELICPGCGDDVADEQPAESSHRDGTALCPPAAGTAAVGPVEAAR
ncbi:MAG: hypothetical protein ACRDRH_11015 [Pseudonocardia sp.]